MDNFVEMEIENYPSESCGDFISLFSTWFPDFKSTWQATRSEEKCNFLLELQRKLETLFLKWKDIGKSSLYTTPTLSSSSSSSSSSPSLSSSLSQTNKLTKKRKLTHCFVSQNEMKQQQKPNHSLKIKIDKYSPDSFLYNYVYSVPSPIWKIIFDFLEEEENGKESLMNLRLTNHYFRNLISQLYPPFIPLSQVPSYLSNCKKFGWELPFLLVTTKHWDDKGRELIHLPSSVTKLKLVTYESMEVDEMCVTGDNFNCGSIINLEKEIFSKMPHGLKDLDLSEYKGTISYEFLPLSIENLTLKWDVIISEEQIIALFTNIPNLNIEFSGPKSLLNWACYNGYCNLVKHLIENKPIIRDSVNHLCDKISPLYAACYHGRKEIAALLIQYGAEINLGRIDYGCTPLYTASASGYKEIVQMLLENGANPNLSRIDDGVSPLYIASENGHLEVVKLLLKYRANVNATCIDDGFSPLMTACNEGSKEIVELLLNYGADIHIQDKLRETAYQKATDEIKQILESYMKTNT